MSATVTVASKLPFSYAAETSDGAKVVFVGGKSKDHTGEGFLTNDFGLTHGVDKAWFDKWKAEAFDFPALKNGIIFAEASPDKAADAGKERKKETRTGLEQKTADELGVVVVEKD